MYGDGVYFAKQAKYSSNSRYSQPDLLGQRYIYLARVLTGEYAQGSKGDIVPPAKSPTSPNILYDSVVDNVNKPGIYVIFQDAQAYPEYMITF